MYNIGLMYLVFPFNFVFYKNIHPKSVTTIKFNKFAKNKIEKDFHNSFVEDRNLFVDSIFVKLSLPTQFVFAFL